MNIAICSDHGGFELKEKLIPFIEEMGHTVTDLGCYSAASVDYPDMAFPMAEAVSRGEYERGVAICGTGIGVSICCNKVRGIRCALCGDVLSAELTRRHNDSNILAMGGRIIGVETAKAIARVWLETGFDGGRHEGRINKITEYENQNGRNHI